MSEMRAAGKGRPTPKRKEKERRRGPVAPPPQTRKEAAQRQREKIRASREKVREGASRGDDRYLTKRDAGPVRKYVRDIVDSRRNAAVLLLPVALLLVVAQIFATRAPLLIDIALALWLGGLLTVLVDAVVLAFTIRRRVRRRFPEESGTARHIGYGLMRSTIFRRWRLPAPAVSPGDPV